MPLSTEALFGALSDNLAVSVSAIFVLFTAGYHFQRHRGNFVQGAASDNHDNAWVTLPGRKSYISLTFLATHACR
jgi:hypothetical protein